MAGVDDVEPALQNAASLSHPLFVRIVRRLPVLNDRVHHLGNIRPRILKSALKLVPLLISRPGKQLLQLDRRHAQPGKSRKYTFFG